LKKMPTMIANVGKLEEAFRTMWMRHNKPEGIEAVQNRFGIMLIRYKELQRRMREYIDGDIKVIAELEYRCPPS